MSRSRYKSKRQCILKQTKDPKDRTCCSHTLGSTFYPSFSSSWDDVVIVYQSDWRTIGHCSLAFAEVSSGLALIDELDETPGSIYLSQRAHCGFNALVKYHLTDICIVTNIADERVSSAAVRYQGVRVVDFSFKLFAVARIYRHLKGAVFAQPWLPRTERPMIVYSIFGSCLFTPTHSCLSSHSIKSASFICILEFLEPGIGL